jgi:hypothetical protein
MGKRGPKKGRGGRPRLKNTPLREYWRKIQNEKKRRDSSR